MGSNTIWDRFIKTINRGSDFFNQTTILWYHKINLINRYGEDSINSNKYLPIALYCLIDFNYRRTWPYLNLSPAGMTDKESMNVYFNRDYLANRGFLNSNGYFNYSIGNDYFVYLGKKYSSSDDTPSGQAGDKPLFFQLILKREERLEGEEIVEPILSPTLDYNVATQGFNVRGIPLFVNLSSGLNIINHNLNRRIRFLEGVYNGENLEIEWSNTNPVTHIESLNTLYITTQNDYGNVVLNTIVW